MIGGGGCSIFPGCAPKKLNNIFATKIFLILPVYVCMSITIGFLGSKFFFFFSAVYVIVLFIVRSPRAQLGSELSTKVPSHWHWHFHHLIK